MLKSLLGIPLLLAPLLLLPFSGAAPVIRGSSSPSANGAAKTPLYVVLRMDDIQYGWNTETQASVVDWALAKRVKINLGIISGPDVNDVAWPTTCATSPTAKDCDDPVVRSVFTAYAAGQVRGAGADSPNVTLEIFNHAWDHNGWPDATDADRAADMAKSVGALRAAFPAASIQTFVPPQNIADASTLAAVAASDMSIISSMGTLACQAAPPNPGVSPRWNYMYAPCQGVSSAWSEPADLLLPRRPGGDRSSGGDDPWFCIPPNDTYADIDGFKMLPEDGGKVHSVPTGSANTPMQYVTTGLEVTAVLGAGACGCANTTCAVVPSAVNNAAKSNGLHWTVMMMHPQTVFCQHGPSTGNPGVCPPSSGAKMEYVEWLDAFVAAAAALDGYDVRFVHFQDLVAMKAPLAPTPAPTHACAGDYKQCDGAGWTSACCSANFVCVSDGSGHFANCQPK